MSDEFKKMYVKQVLDDLGVVLATPCPCDRTDPEWDLYKGGYDHALDKVAGYVSLLRQDLEV